MTLDGGGGGDIFEGMTHEQMLKWLGRADHGTVQAAADRLTAAAKEIHKIAKDLKTRPQYVSWKGDGADAFRAWSADLAKSAIHMGDFSQNSGKWLAQASHAIAKAKSQMPPLPDDSGSGSGKTVSSTGGKAAKGVDPLDPTGEKEKVRLEAASEMQKLGQSYQQASTQMDSYKRPVFPPMPDAIAPSDSSSDRSSQDLARSGASASSGTVSGSTSDSVARQHGSISDNIGTRHSPAELSVDRPSLKEVPPIGTDLDSVDVLPKTPPPARSLPDVTTRPEAPPVTGHTDPSLPFTPALGQGPGKPVPTARGRVLSEGPATGGRVPPRQVVGGVPQRDTTSRTPMGRAAQNPTRGIVGGRPSQTQAGKSTTGVSRSPVVGGKGTQKNAPSAGRTGGTTRTPAPRPGRPSGQNPARPKAMPSTGVPSRSETPARGLPPQTTGGVIGSRTPKQQPSGHLPSGASAPMKGGIAGGVPSKESRTGTHNAGASAQPDASRSSQQGEQRQPEQSKKSKQSQQHVTTEPQKKNRP